MEWERAKNYILIAFVLLNLGLAALLFIEDRRYTLTSDRIRAVHTVLSNNDISLYTIPMRRFAPMRHLDISGFYYDIPHLLDIFFPETQVIETNPAEGIRIFEPINRGNKRLEISNGFISFDKSRDFGENDISITRDEAVRISDEFILLHFPDFVRDMVFDEYGGEGVEIIYRQEYRGRLIYSNRIHFLVTGQGIEWIGMQFGRVVGHSTESRMIFAPDEILLTFMQHMFHEALENPIFITHIDMVYLQEYVSDQEGAVYPAVPFYRIFMSDNDIPLKINAYTNIIFN